MKIYITRQIPETGIKKLKDKGYEIIINPLDKGFKQRRINNCFER